MAQAARFDVRVEPGGYAWWYVDALSDDGRDALTLIAFVGSVFSPYYAAARRRSALADPAAHCALNVALYGPGRQRWAMTERGAMALDRGPDHLRIGPSGLAWRGDRLDIDVAEWTAPFPSRLRGRLRLDLVGRANVGFALDDRGDHLWTPIAPRARIEVDFEHPRLRWRGDAYLDANRGTAPLERAFRRWHWSRTAATDGSSQVLYDIEPRGAAAARALALRFDRHGAVETLAPPPLQALPPTGWRLGRTTRADADQPAVLLRTLEDGPFYARSLLRTAGATAVHESLCLDRFAARWVQALLPFRMPRRG